MTESSSRDQSGRLNQQNKNQPTVAQKLSELLTYIAKKESQIEASRVKLAKMPQFEPR